MLKTEQWVKEYEELHGKRRGTMDGIRSLNYVLGFLSIFVASSSFNYESEFLGGGLSDLGIPIWHIRPLPFPLMEILFFVSGLWMVLSTYFDKGVIGGYGSSFVVWMGVGMTWIVYAIMYHPDYVFTFGVMGLFISTMHVILAQIWSLEKVV